MTRPGTPPYVGSCRECGVVNGHSVSCRVDLIVEGITRGLRREGYILIEASHHAELVGVLSGVTLIAACKVDPGCDEDIATVERAQSVLAKIGGEA